MRYTFRVRFYFRAMVFCFISSKKNKKQIRKKVDFITTISFHCSHQYFSRWKIDKIENKMPSQVLHSRKNYLISLRRQVINGTFLIYIFGLTRDCTKVSVKIFIFSLFMATLAFWYSLSVNFYIMRVISISLLQTLKKDSYWLTPHKSLANTAKLLSSLFSAYSAVRSRRRAKKNPIQKDNAPFLFL